MVAKRAGKPIPPNISGIGNAGPSLGYLIVALPMAIATTLQRIITNATLGLQGTLEGKAARRVACNVKEVNLCFPLSIKLLQQVDKHLDSNVNFNSYQDSHPFSLICCRN